MPEIVPEKSQAPDAAKIHDELGLFVKYIERFGEISMRTNVDADANTRERIRMDLDITLVSPSS